MARKAILEGGKRDEIIAAATKLFFTEGFENTSVRKILSMVNGEVGMFYHYFASKEELFDVVTDRFFRQYAAEFEEMINIIISCRLRRERFGLGRRNEHPRAHEHQKAQKHREGTARVVFPMGFFHRGSSFFSND